jgi:pentatricopeptide repeat protein
MFTRNFLLSSLFPYLNIVTRYNTLIHLCDKKNLVEKAFELFEQMKIDNVAPNGDTYGSLESLTTRVNRFDLFRKCCGDYFFLQRPAPM